MNGTRRRREREQMKRKNSSAATSAGRPPPRETGEERSADAATIAWMLSAIATLAAELVAGLAAVVNWLAGDSDKLPAVSRVLPSWFLFCAVVTGLLCLVLTPLVHKIRRQPPPRSVTITAVVIGLVPLVTLIVRATL
jgi:hypothetical protein